MTLISPWSFFSTPLCIKALDRSPHICWLKPKYQHFNDLLKLQSSFPWNTQYFQLFKETTCFSHFHSDFSYNLRNDNVVLFDPGYFPLYFNSFRLLFDPFGFFHTSWNHSLASLLYCLLFQAISLLRVCVPFLGGGEIWATLSYTWELFLEVLRGLYAVLGIKGQGQMHARQASYLCIMRLHTYTGGPKCQRMR